MSYQTASSPHDAIAHPAVLVCGAFLGPLAIVPGHPFERRDMNPARTRCVHALRQFLLSVLILTVRTLGESAINTYFALTT